MIKDNSCTFPSAANIFNAILLFGVKIDVHSTKLQFRELVNDLARNLSLYIPTSKHNKEDYSRTLKMCALEDD